MIIKYLIRKFIIQSLLSGTVLFILSNLKPGSDALTNIYISFFMGGIVGLIFLFYHTKKHNLQYLYFNLKIKYRKIFINVFFIYQIIIILIVISLWTIIH
ncbi:MAG: hypothetical protein HW421_1023 [Ignavibacteria bacterium]|nr:hypothetical protein [Ignavibacteria bacterium]